MSQLDEKVFEEIPNQIQQMISDYKNDINKGYYTGTRGLSISFASKLVPDENGVKVTTTISFDPTKPDKKKSTVIKDSMEVVVGKQLPLPTE